MLLTYVYIFSVFVCNLIVQIDYVTYSPIYFINDYFNFESYDSQGIVLFFNYELIKYFGLY